MQKVLLLSILLTSLLMSCKQSQQSVSNIEPTNLSMNPLPNSVVVEVPTNCTDNNFIDSQYSYADSEGKEVTIINSLPKGGLKYTDAVGNDYVYAVFWTQVVNETTQPLEFTMNCLDATYSLPSAPDRVFKLHVPLDTMTMAKIPLFNFGLDLQKSLYRHHQQINCTKIIQAKSIGAFYVVVLFNKGVDGTVRAGLRLRGQQVLYRIKDKVIECGYINSKLLTAKE